MGMFTCLRSIIGVVTLVAFLVPTASLAQTVDLGSDSISDTGTSAAESAESPIFGIVAVGDHPSGYFDDVPVMPGETVELTASLVNQSAVPVRLQAFKVNALSAVNGGFLAGERDDPPAPATSWIDFPALDVELGPWEQHPVTFTVSVPDDTSPGQYIAGLVVQLASEPLEGSGVLSKVRAYAISVGILVPGELTHAFEPGAPAIEHSTLRIPITNTGTYLVRPSGELEMTNAAGDRIHASTISMGSVYAGLTTEIRVALPEQLAPGDYQVSLELTDEASGATAEVVDAVVTVSEPVEPIGIALTAARISPNADPIAFADVAITIENRGDRIPAATIDLVVTLDGEELERYPVASGMELPGGVTELTDRYVPANAWGAGTYSFQIVVSAVDRESDAVTVLTTVDVDDTIVVP